MFDLRKIEMIGLITWFFLTAGTSGYADNKLKEMVPKQKSPTSTIAPDKVIRRHTVSPGTTRSVTPQPFVRPQHAPVISHPFIHQHTFTSVPQSGVAHPKMEKKREHGYHDFFIGIPIFFPNQIYYYNNTNTSNNDDDN